MKNHVAVIGCLTLLVMPVALTVDHLQPEAPSKAVQSRDNGAHAKKLSEKNHWNVHKVSMEDID